MMSSITEGFFFVCLVFVFVLRGEGKTGEDRCVVGGNGDSTAGCQSPLEMSDCLEKCQKWVGACTTEKQGKPGPLRGA